MINNIVKGNSIDRIFNAVKADIIFQWKQGFHIIYIIISLIYIVSLNQLPNEIVKLILPLVIYSDPSVLGMFFIGGIVLLEKEQGVLMLLKVTPLKMSEYIISKVISLSMISVFFSIFISFFSYRQDVNYFYLIIGVTLSSIFFILIGLIIITKSKSINEYIFKMIPYLLVILFPCVSLIVTNIEYLFYFFPSVVGIRLILGAYNTIGYFEVIIQAIILIFLNIILAKYVNKIFEEKMIQGG